MLPSSVRTIIFGSLVFIGQGGGRASSECWFCGGGGSDHLLQTGTPPRNKKNLQSAGEVEEIFGVCSGRSFKRMCENAIFGLFPMPRIFFLLCWKNFCTGGSVPPLPTRSFNSLWDGIKCHIHCKLAAVQQKKHQNFLSVPSNAPDTTVTFLT